MTTPRKPRVATVWLGGCSGCHMSFLDLDEWLFELATHFDVVFSPVMDVKQYPAAVDVCLIEGAHTWDVAFRGHNARVITDLNQPWGESATCTSCGKCVQACPTGALFYQGSTVAEMQHDKAKLAFLVNARERKQWNV